ncbi:ParA family protein [Kitasatospora sp. GP82]|uniref:ParA family protein n=1 Tax=Kitasatospora sp. GP82 TaxID=3035089 RepID=UPI002475AEB6|nr:ParA family protein [Kitasatospora sp. GP82]MDH6130501.1 cellulose biosynthesis protein BcsQ [Kitasatospora sp. GP82]
MLHTFSPLYAPDLPPVFAAMNRAGSVGKTTIGWNLCVQAARRGYKVLFVDADLQSDASYWSGWDGDELPKGVVTVHKVMLGQAKMEEAIVPARTRIRQGDGPNAFKIIDGLDLVRGDEKMSQADIELAQDPKGVFWLQRSLRRYITKGQYDFVWIDCPASLSLLSISILIASTNIFVCTKPGRKELRGAKSLLRRIKDVRDEYEDFGAMPLATWFAMNETKASNSQGQFYLERQREGREVYGDRMLNMLKATTAVAEAYDAQEPLAFWVPKHEATLTIDSMLTQMGFTDRRAA